MKAKIKSRVALWILIGVVSLMVVFLQPNRVQAAQADDFTYEVHDGKATITGTTWEYSYVIDIPQTIDGYPVVSIGAQAFQDNAYVGMVYIPEGVETIEGYAFYQCYNLQYLELPNSLKTIGKNAFCNCKLLEEITWGEDLRTIDEGAFSFCKSLDFYLDLPDNLETIGTGAFYGCHSLETVMLPKSIKDLGSKAFAMCRKLDYIYIPDNIPKIGSQLLYESACYYYADNWYKDAFYWGPYLLEAKKTISGSFTPLIGTTNIADGAFENCNNLTEVILPEGLRIIGQSAFEDCDGLQRIVIPEGVTTIGDKAFYDCKAATEIEFPSSVTSLGQDVFTKSGFYNDAQNWENNAFYVGEHLVSCNTKLSGSLEVRPGTKTIVSGAMKGLTKLTELVLPDSLTTIGREALADCTALTKITISNGVTDIGEKAFYGCKALKTVHLGKQVSQIGEGAFAQCAALENITVDSGNQTYRSQVNCLIRGNTLVLGCKASRIPQDGNVTAIGPYAFEGCVGLTQITIPDAVLSVGEGAFRDCNALTSVSLGNGVQTVGKYAFAECDVLSDIELGDSLHTIDDFGFAYNNRIKSVQFPGSLRYLGEEAFSNAIDLKTVTFQEGLLKIGKSCFIFCENLTAASLPDSLEEIGEAAFNGCEELETLTLGEGLKTIGDTAFMYCEKLKSLTIPHSVQTIGSYAFSECYDLQYLDLGRVNQIGRFAFSDCKGLSRVSVPSSVTNMELGVFAFCPALEELTVSTNNPYFMSRDNCIIKKYEKLLMSGCKNSIIPTDGTVTTINGYAFAGATGLEFIKVPTQVTRICAAAFVGCTGLREIHLPFIGGEADSYHGRLGYIFTDDPMPANQLPPYSLEKVVILGGTNVGTSAFEKCVYLEEIVLPETINWVGYSAFAGCSSLEKVVLPGNVETFKDTNIFSTAPKAFLYVSNGQESTVSYAMNNNIRHYIGGLITFEDQNGQCIEKTWYANGRQIVAPELPDDQARWSAEPGRCSGNQTFRLTYGEPETDKPQADLNADAQIDNRDVEYLLWHTLFPASYPIENSADFNSDGAVDNLDVEYLLWHTLFPETYPI